MSLSREQIEALDQLAREKKIGPYKDAGNDDAETLRPEFELPTADREVHDFARELGELITKKSILFRRGRVPVLIEEKKKQFEVMSAETFLTWISDHAACYKEKTVRDDVVRKFYTMAIHVSRAVLASPQFALQLPEVQRLNETRLPIIRKGGEIQLLPPGFFYEQGIYTIDDGIVYDEAMTLADARAAVDELISEFPFLSDRSKAVCVAAMLTMFCAAMLPKNARPPAFIYTANSPRAGKTLLAKVAIITVAGAAAARTFPRYEEARKVLDAIALEGSNYVLFDNIRGKIQGEEIESFITSGRWEARPLGQSTSVRVDNIASVFFTGNQSTHSQDIADRCLFVELFVQEADSRDRYFTRIIDDAFLADVKQRSKILSALWAFVRAWDNDGRKPGKAKLPGFEAWSKIVPSIVLHAGYGDCLERPDIKGAETEVADMRTLVASLAPAIDAAPELRRLEYQFDDLITKLRELGLFDDLEARTGRRSADLFEDDGSITRAGRAIFGKLFTRYDQRLFTVGDMRLRFVVIGRGDARRYVVTLGG